MTHKLFDLLERLETDTWRSSTPFSTAMSAANAKMFHEVRKENSKGVEETLTEWLLRHQPCVFGRLAARKGLIAFCIITEKDIREGDAHVAGLIQSSRLRWRQEAFEGRKSGFVILVACERLATAVPNNVVLEFARAVTSMYLERDIDLDSVYNDELFLEIPSNGAILKWLVGVNYFTSQSDGRWWQDHRIPGGIALSMNSVGHLVKSAILLHHVKDLELALGIDGEPDEPINLESLPRALELAMRTILNASDACSGRATFLIERSSSRRSCPVEISENLDKYDCIEYAGYYDTDVTLPSTYFLPDVARPSRQKKVNLDFSYLVDSRFENPDHITLGTGRRVRAAGAQGRLFKLVPHSVNTIERELVVKLLKSG